MQNERDKIGTRLAQILMRLNDGERFSVADLAHEFNVSVRTIQRDINQKLTAIPLNKDKNGKYYLEPYALGNLSFKDIKNFAILSGISSLYPSLDRDFISELLTLKNNEAYLIKNHGFERIDDKKDEFKKISLAIIKQNAIEITYNDKKRTIKPYKLINNNGIWYVLADDDGRLKTFLLSKISNFCYLKDSRFVPNPDFVKIVMKNDSNWFHQTQKEIILQISGDAVYYFLRKNVFANMEILEQTDEKLIVKTLVCYDDEAINVALSYMPFIKILSPKELQNDLNDMLKEYLKDFSF